MQAARMFRKPALAAIAASALVLVLLVANRGNTAHAQSSTPQNSVELDQILFVQILPLPKGVKNGKDGYTLAWIPAPLLKYCLGKTHQACATMDFCLRTTSPEIAMCRNLGSALTRMPRYPANMNPRRMLSIALLPPSTMQGFDLLEKLAATMPHTQPQLFSPSARVKARVRLIHKPDDDDFNVLAILSAAPF
jgi:hypothetical protein